MTTLTYPVNRVPAASPVAFFVVPYILKKTYPVTLTPVVASTLNTPFYWGGLRPS